MKNNEKTFAYLEDALKIHAICSDFAISDNDARLLTYIHAKCLESGIGTCYFDTPSEHDSNALEIMLGYNKESLPLPGTPDNTIINQKIAAFTSHVASKIARLDSVLAHNFGMENRLTGELKARLRLYGDDKFRDAMVTLYSERIVPQLTKYSKEMIDKAFTRHRARQLRLEQELKEMTGLESI